MSYDLKITKATETIILGDLTVTSTNIFTTKQTQLSIFRVLSETTGKWFDQEDGLPLSGMMQDIVNGLYRKLWLEQELAKEVNDAVES